MDCIQEDMLTRKIVIMNNNDNRSRYIPSTVRKEVNERDCFECAWCGVKFTEYHHIIEFSDGGEHTSENLILLCSTCHGEFHNKKGDIKEGELINRKSVHSAGDRIAGNMQFSADENKVKCGDLYIINHNPLLTFGDEPVLSLIKHGNEYLLNCRFYDENGNLIFWMSKNRYWTIDSFIIKVTRNSIEITKEDQKDNYLKIEQVDDYFKLECKNYHKGQVVEFGSSGLSINGRGIQFAIGGSGTLDVNGKGAIRI